MAATPGGFRGALGMGWTTNGLGVSLVIGVPFHTVVFPIVQQPTFWYWDTYGG